eukprot:scaffold1238_cov116-Isochrysis_galbana.AAC.6
MGQGRAERLGVRVGPRLWVGRDGAPGLEVPFRPYLSGSISRFGGGDAEAGMHSRIADGARGAGRTCGDGCGCVKSGARVPRGVAGPEGGAASPPRRSA